MIARHRPQLMQYHGDLLLNSKRCSVGYSRKSGNQSAVHLFLYRFTLTGLSKICGNTRNKHELVNNGF